ncbi:MAG: EexN family lipoprotein [Syntrophotalea acetylenica]|uniref:EexN family lipoprotein n=1 Tax=Syntrophotalea acetylenica TaxID=29542 RepID=A0A1L3GDH8_SYNAC|nr:EexN family lipoprotein [Syntrophotalea acetylenica]APG23885.1 hypothetical protein A7E75_01725 [Syntrophotalea acetylenica]APG44465.1 hypothetical protein A6070_10340 [Syntrophotalea acetylenica]MDD4456350.1 EexN family lipoprotein [Syntrophotalea acetylenica]
MAKKTLSVRNAVLLIVVFSCCFLGGCGQDKSLVTGETKSFEWFIEHPDARRKALSVCSENNWELKDLPNCDNAIEAETVVRVRRKRMNK